LQVVAVVAPPLAQLAAVHCVELPGNVQAAPLVPSQEL
jgi:hypothetical protein